MYKRLREKIRMKQRIDKIKEYMSNTGLDRNEIASLLGVSKSTVDSWMNNRRSPSLGVMAHLDTLMRENDNENK